MINTVAEGQAIVFVDAYKETHDALVTKVFGRTEWDDEKPLDVTFGSPDFNWPTTINLVWVATDSRIDQYGKQTIHESSVAHEAVQSAGAYCWRFKK